MRRLYLVAFFLLSTLLQAQDPAPETGSGPALPVLQEKLQREIAAIDKRLVEPDLAESAIRELRSTRASLERLALIYERHAVAEQLAGDLAVTIETAKTRLDQLQNHGLNEPPPYEFMKLEQVRDSLKIERTKWDALASTSQVTTDSLAAAKAEADAAESTMFKAREKLAANPGAPAGKSLRGLAQDARLKNAIAAGLVAEARAEGLARENQRLQLVILEQTVHVMEPHCRFARKDLDLILVSVEHEDAQLRTELHQIRSELEHADRQWIRAREAADPQAAGRRHQHRLLAPRSPNPPTGERLPYRQARAPGRGPRTMAAALYHPSRAQESRTGRRVDHSRAGATGTLGARPRLASGANRRGTGSAKSAGR